jgi:Ca2+-binding EF-hand superfamily protein
MTKNLHPTFAALAAFCLATAGCQTTTQTQPDRFAKADTNHDGKLSLDEVNIFIVTPIFESRDTNHDGKLTKAEWVVNGDKEQTKQFELRDANHDGVVTMDEALAYGKKKGMAAKAMKEADTNKDGSVSREEATAYYGKHE